MKQRHTLKKKPGFHHSQKSARDRVLLISFRLKHKAKRRCLPNIIDAGVLAFFRP